MPISATTALQGLRLGRIEAGQHVLIIGASGGVGTYAVQLAKAFGTEVTGVCSAAKADLVRSLGADHTIDYAVGGESNADLVPLTELIDAGQLTPSIDATYTLAEAPVAMRHLEAGTVRGKSERTACTIPAQDSAAHAGPCRI